jgi:peptide/nickel transport system permease protein
VSIGGTEALPASESGSALDFLDLGGEIAARSPLQLFWRRLRQDRVALVSGIIIVALIVIAVAAPLIIKILGLPGPNVQNLNLTDEFGSPLGPTSSATT